MSYLFVCCFFFFKQKTAYEMRISDWSSDVCSSDLNGVRSQFHAITFFTLLISLGWRGLLIPSGYGADTATQTMMLCIHVGIICVGGLTFSMIPQAAQVYIITPGISVQFHLDLQSHPLSPLLTAAVILCVLLLRLAFFQLLNHIVRQIPRAA